MINNIINGIIDERGFPVRKIRYSAPTPEHMSRVDNGDGKSSPSSAGKRASGNSRKKPDNSSGFSGTVFTGAFAAKKASNDHKKV